MTDRAGADLNPHNSLCKIFLAQVKALPLEDGIDPGLVPFILVDEPISYAGEVEYFKVEPQLALLDEVDGGVSQYAAICHVNGPMLGTLLVDYRKSSTASIRAPTVEAGYSYMSSTN